MSAIANHPTSTLQVTSALVSTLVPDPKNARVHTERQVKQLSKSIDVFGFTCPVLVDHNNHVIAGHGRLLAIKQLGWNHVPIIKLEHLTPDQVRAYRLADNRLSEIATWDERLLAKQLKQLSEADLDFDIDVIGFDVADIDLRIQGLGDLDDEPNVAPSENEGAGVTKVGDVWQLGPHRIVCGNALQAGPYTALLEGQLADMAFVDFPFNLSSSSIGGKGAIKHDDFVMCAGEMSRAEFIDFLSKAMGLLRQNLASGALIFGCQDWRHGLEIGMAAESQGLELKNLCVWVKNCGGMGAFYRSQHELVYVFKSGTAKHTNNIQLGRHGRNRTNVWHYDGVGSNGHKTEEGNLLAMHPSVKPVALVADAILDASKRGDRILDSFLGSGSTIIAAEKTGRIGLGIELDPKYVDVAIRRWQRLSGQQAVNADTQQTFGQCEQERSLAGPALEVVPA